MFKHLMGVPYLLRPFSSQNENKEPSKPYWPILDYALQYIKYYQIHLHHQIYP